MTAAFITGCAGVALTNDERSFIRDAHPAGLILFTRNCETPAQVRTLVDDFRSLAGDDAIVAVDQEGGRVQRMGPPAWPAYPAAAAFADRYRTDRASAVEAAFAVARLCADDLSACGISMNCVPVLDVPQADAHEIIGTRAYGQEPETIIALARAVSDGHLAGAVAPVAKHLPGHGRSKADSHLALPVVDTPYDELARTDFAPFVALADLPAGMTAHIVYTALDEQECASTSARIISNIIRGQFGFDGLLMSDDLSMAALTGSIADRTARVRRAGCDIALHCNGRLDEMVEVADAAGMLGEDGVRRLRDLHAARGQPEPYDRAAAERMRDALLASAPV